MNKRLLTFGTMIFMTIFLLVLAGCNDESSDGGTEASGSGGSGTEEIVLRGSTFIPAEHGAFDQINPWIEQIEEETDGQVKFEVFTSGELVKAGNSYDALISGIADVELSFLAAYEPQRFPLTEVTTLPLVYSDAKIASTAFKNMIDSDVEIADGQSYYELEFASEGLKALPVVTTEPYVIATTANHFESVDDFSNASLRSAARTHEFLIRNLGSNSITLPSTDLYEALGRNALDGSIQSVADWSAYGLQEIFKFTLDGINLGHYAPVIAMTEEKWNSFPENVQDVMERAVMDTTTPAYDGWTEREEFNRTEYTEQGGVFIHVDELAPEVQEHVYAAMEQTWYDWIETVESEGNPGREMAKLWRDLIIEAGGEVPEGVKDL